MTSAVGLSAKDMGSPTQTTPSSHINQPGWNQRDDQHASQPESMASVSQYFAPIQAEFNQECDNFEQHLRQTCDEFASIQKETIESSGALADQFLTKSKLQQQLKQAKEDRAAQLSFYGLEMTTAGNVIDIINSKLDTLKNEIRRHFNEQTELCCRGAKKEAEEYREQHIHPLELRRDQLETDIERLKSTDRQIVSITQEINKNSNSIEELEKTVKNHMEELRFKTGAFKAAMRDEQRDQQVQKDADIAAVREDMKGQMKEQADQFTAQTGNKAGKVFTFQLVILVLHLVILFLNFDMKEARQYQPDSESQFKQVQFSSSATLNSTEELFELITAPQDSPILASLTSLDLSKCKLGDKKADFFNGLFKMPNLTSLDLSGSGIRDDGAQFLATSETLANLTSLNLSGNNIGDNGVKALAASKALINLTSLALDGNKIGDNGIKALAASTTLPNLTSLNLGDNYIGDNGVEALAASETFNNLTSLDFRRNKIGAAGAKATRTKYPFVLF